MSLGSGRGRIGGVEAPVAGCKQAIVSTSFRFSISGRDANATNKALGHEGATYTGKQHRARTNWHSRNFRREHGLDFAKAPCTPSGLEGIKLGPEHVQHPSSMGRGYKVHLKIKTRVDEG